MRPLRTIGRLLGPYGLLGLAVAALCAVFYFTAVKPAEMELTARQEAAQRLKSRAPALQPVSVDSRADDLRRFYALFPPSEKIAPEAQKLWQVAAKYNIELQQGEYRLELSGPGLMRYRITLPIRASYAQVRQFVGYILKEIPTLSIDGLRFERKTISETQLEAQLRLTLYFRPGTVAAAKP